MKLVQIYRCLCDETRLRILHLLKQGPLCVCHFQEILQLPQVAVSKHLAYLRRTGMVEARRHEQWMIYSLPASPCRELSRQLSCLQDCVQTEAVFRKDLRRLKALGPKCNWVPKAMGLAQRRHGAISQEVGIEFGSSSSPRRGGCCG
jgi:ArsR family transcriptional regulator